MNLLYLLFALKVTSFPYQMLDVKFRIKHVKKILPTLPIFQQPSYYYERSGSLKSNDSLPWLQSLSRRKSLCFSLSFSLISYLATKDVLNIAEYVTVFSAFVRSLGGTPFSIGLINSSSALISLLWNPVVGSLSDQVGRKGLLIKCLVASATGSVIMAFSSSVCLVFIGKLIGSLGSPVSILLRSIVADVYKSPEERKTFFTKCAPVMSVAFLVGTLSGGFLSEVKHGYRLTFLLMATIMSTAAIIAYQKITNDIKPKEKGDRTSSFASRAVEELKSAVVDLKTISWPRYKYLFYVKGFYDLSIAVIFSNVGLVLLNEFDVRGRTIGYVFMMTSICRIASSILKLKLKNILSEIPDNLKLITGGTVLLISYIMMGWSTSLSIFLIFLAVMCISRAFMDTTLTEIITTRTKESDRGKVIGAYENLYSFTMFVAPLSTGVLAELLGQRIVIGSAAIPIGIAVFVAYREERPKTE